MNGERRAVLRPFLGVDESNALVSINTGTTVYVIGEPDHSGFIEVNCVSCTKTLRVFAEDLYDRTAVVKTAAGAD